MFKFGFSLSQKEDSIKTGDEVDNVVWQPSEEIFPADSKLDFLKKNNVIVDLIQFQSESVLCVKPASVLSSISNTENPKNENILLAEKSHSDLVPSKYEGGLKIWECTHDLANYLDSCDVAGKTVLDLGCGVGLLGILALKKGAEAVYCQDYNADVLQYATIPNVELNCNAQEMTNFKFYSGDWESFSEQAQFTCDMVLTSETIYNPINYLKLHNTIRKLLKPNGVALLGAKTYYFGVGGSTRQFEKLIKELDVFNVEVVWKCSEGVQREILKLTFKKS